jgi:hypothetical protein
MVKAIPGPGINQTAKLVVNQTPAVSHPKPGRAFLPTSETILETGDVR